MELFWHLCWCEPLFILTGVWDLCSWNALHCILRVDEEQRLGIQAASSNPSSIIYLLCDPGQIS